MKKSILLFLTLFILGSTLTTLGQDDPKTMNPPDGKAIIYIIRMRDTYGMFRSVNKIDGTELPTLGSRDFVYKVVDPGDHKVTSKGSTKESEIEVKAEAGKKYFVIQRCKMMVMGVYWTNLSMENDMKKAQNIIKDCTEAKFKDAK